MKHNIIVTVLLVSFFVLAQVTGLWLLNMESQLGIDPVTNSTTVTFNGTAIGDRPETTGSGSLIYILIAIAIGTGLVLLIARFGKTHIWRIWFFMAVWMAMAVSIGVLIKAKIFFNYDIAIVVSLILAAWKIFRPNVILHNATEVLMYAGIALIIVPLFDVKWAIILLIIIAVYDAYAVWKSKHMVKMAEFQTKSEIFAGLMIPYRQDSKGKNFEILQKPAPAINNTTPKIRAGKTSPKNAILGGGDIAFPLIFIGSVMNDMIVKMHDASPALALEQIKIAAFLQSSIIIATATISLLLLFIYAKKGRYYPAMPFLTAGCLIGWAITLLI